MKIIFAGTPQFAVPSLAALVDSGHEILAVFTQPDRPAGRGQKLTPSPVKQWTLSHSLPIYQPISLRDPQQQKLIGDLQADLMVVVAYGLLLPKPVLLATEFGCINVHASLLPRWRGAAPIQQAILAGDTETGVTIMQMDEGLDTGDILLTASCAISSTDTSEDLHERLAKMGAELLLKAIAGIENKTLKAKPQDNSQATHAPKIDKAQAQLDWRQSAVELSRKIRGFNPWPIAYCRWQEQGLRIWQAIVLDQETTQSPGSILAASKEGIDVATGRGVLRLLKVQLPGGKPLSVGDFLNAHQLSSNSLLPPAGEGGR